MVSNHFFLPATKIFGASSEKKTPFCSKWQPEKKEVEKLFESLWAGATYSWHRKQHFNKWKSFSIKSSAHGRQRHIATEGPESLLALCAISVTGLKRNKLYKILCSSVRTNYVWMVIQEDESRTETGLQDNLNVQLKIQNLNASRDVLVSRNGISF